MSVELRGLDGSNPLAFLAALGTLRLLTGPRASRTDTPGLHWCHKGRWLPVLQGPASLDDIVAAVLEDLPTWEEEPALRFAYNLEGLRIAPDAKGAVLDLKPSPQAMRELLDEAAGRAARGDRRSADTVAAFGTDVAVDNNGRTKPTALHFTAGQQTFLKMVRELRRSLTADHLHEALGGPWLGRSKLPSLSWDATATRLYALRGFDPSHEKRGSVPGADWLAVLGLALLPVFPRGTREPLTTGVTGGWKDGVLTWPLWDRPATMQVVRSLLNWRDLASALPTERAARGVVVVLQSSITRSDQGGYGSFSPARVL